MMEFIDDNVIVEILRGPFCKFRRIKGLNADKEMLNVCRFVAVHVELSEVEVI